MYESILKVSHFCSCCWQVAPPTLRPKSTRPKTTWTVPSQAVAEKKLWSSDFVSTVTLESHETNFNFRWRGDELREHSASMRTLSGLRMMWLLFFIGVLWQELHLLFSEGSFTCMARSRCIQRSLCPQLRNYPLNPVSHLTARKTTPLSRVQTRDPHFAKDSRWTLGWEGLTTSLTEEKTKQNNDFRKHCSSVFAGFVVGSSTQQFICTLSSSTV